MSEHTEAKSVHERIAFVRRIEINFPPDGRDAKAVAIMRYACDHATEQPAIIFDLRFAIRVVSDGSKAERIQGANGPGAHGKNIADDATDTGRRALERFDRA